MRIVIVLLVAGIAVQAFSNVLIKAVQSNSLNAVKVAVAAIDDINAADELGYTALHHAGRLGNYEIVSYLLAYEVNAKLYNNDHKVAFQLAIEEQAMTAERAKVAAILLHATKGIEGRDQKGWTALYWAILSKDRELIDRFLDEGAKLVRHAQQSRLVMRQHALEVATLVKDQPLLDYLIDKFVEAEGEQALHTAVMYNLYQIVDILIERGFLENERYVNNDDEWEDDVIGQSYLQGDYYYEGNPSLLNAAIRTRSPRLVTLLLDNGLSPDGKGGMINPIKAAVRIHEFDIFKLLIAYGAKVSQSTMRDWDDVLKLAAANERETLDLVITEFLREKSFDELLMLVREWYSADKLLHVIDSLVQSGLEVIKSKHAQHMLHRAIVSNNSIILEGLLKRGVDVDTLNSRGNTPLLEAAVRGHELNALLLLKYGANINATSSEGMTAIDIAKIGEERMEHYSSQMSKERYGKIIELLTTYQTED